jgi:FtsP/CotA-like multicopper oxidase with cupredoxin domain
MERIWLMSSRIILPRRRFLQLAALGGGTAALSGAGAFGGPSVGNAFWRVGDALADVLYIEAFPTSPLILSPFIDTLPIPRALAPVPRATYSGWARPPGPGLGQQDSDGATHQVWPSKIGYPDPIVYQIKVQVAQHTFTSSQVLPIGTDGKPSVSFDAAGNPLAAGTVRRLPLSTIYGFNGTFPGPRINAEYGRPALVRFENHLDENPLGFNRADFGSPEWGFLTHLHNGHTAPESDGNPNYRHHEPNAPLGSGGYLPGQWVDNLYLNWPAGGDDKEKQSFFWFHDHFHNHTGANVFKGMVGLYPIYDPEQSKDMGDETKGFRLPGVRTNNPDGSFDVDYDIPLAFYDVRLDDGVTVHKDAHHAMSMTHPEWWGQSFFQHFPNHGFVGDIFTVNGVAYPVLEVKRRKYRLRFLDASVSRIYQFQLMSSTGGPRAAKDLGYIGDELQGQYRLPDGQQCMKFLQIASEGGLLPTPIVRDSFELWPAKRREFIVDFTKYQDGSPTRKGDVIYLTNLMKMHDGRMWDSPDPNYKVPVLKIVIGDDAPDNSLIPTALRSIPAFPTGEWKKLLDNRRIFELVRSGFGDELEWGIKNGNTGVTEAWDPTKQMASVKQGAYEVWEIRNGGGGWVHPMHIHQEEHRVVMRNGKPVPDSRHPDDVSKEDVVALDPGESVVICREFRDFVGKYVAHCHNLAHEDHAMMFGWEIVP